MENKQPFDELMEEARKALKACHRDFTDFKQSQRHLWQRWAGCHLAEMLETANAAARYLDDVDKHLRLAALAILVFHWRATTAMAPIFERMAFEDADQEVRAAALVALGVSWAATKDERIQKLFAAIVRDETQPPEFRRVAYANIFQVRGLTVDLWPAMGSTFRVPEDVDWTFVESAEHPH